MAQKKQKQDDSYWLARGIKQEKKINDAAQQVEQKVITAYRQAQNYLTQQAKKLFNRAKQRSGMDENETRALLNQTVPPDELVELRKLADDISNPDLQESARKRLNGLAFKERITRAEDLKAKSFLVSKQIADVQLDKSTEFYVDVIHDSYNEATAETVIQQIEQAKNDSIINVWDGQKYDSQIETFRQSQKRGIPIEVWNDPKHRVTDYEFKELSTKYTKNILDSHWHGSNYSKRIWKDTEALAKRLEELFTVESMTGMSEFEMAKAISAEFDRSIGVAQRLIRTEANYMANQAKLKAWRDRGVKEYRLIAVLDFRTSKICQGKDGKIYLVSEAVVNGAAGTYPPFHPWCRTIAVAYIGKRSLTGKRTANDPISGKTMTIEQRDTYDDWMKKLKENYSDEEIEVQKKMIQNRKKDISDLKRLKDTLGDEHSPKSLEEYQETKYNDSEAWEQLKRKYSLQRSINKGTLTTNLHLESQQRHELGHPRYEKYVAKNKAKGRPTPSYITADMEKLQKIVDESYLSGVIDRKKPGQALIEIEIDTDKYGVAYDRRGKNPAATNRYKIHMSKAKTHIVPMHPTEGK
jgi:SPP1 gp7 family putative phage head morphogenesis protein